MASNRKVHSGGKEFLDCKPRLGIDIGRVIINANISELKRLATATTPFHKSFISVRPVQGAFRTIRKLVTLFGGRVWLVSKAGKETQIKVCTWLAARNFFSYTGVPHDHIKFCSTFEAKGPISEELGLTHFVDDEPSVHTAIPMVPHRILFHPAPFEWGRYPGIKGVVQVVTNWEDAERIIRKTLKK